MVYGRGIMEQPGTTAHRRELFRLSSTDWHKFLGFSSSDDGGADSALGQARRRWRLQQTPMEPRLQQLMGTESARFRGVQAAAMHAIQHGQSPVVAVMPTGSGKSMLFMLPAWVAPRGTTVVVVPLLALRGGFTAAVCPTGYIMRGVGEPAPPRRRFHRASHPGVRHYGGFHDIFEPAAAPAPFGPDRDR